jgi:hypothetical protein
MTRSAWDIFAKDIKPEDRDEVLRAVHGCIFGAQDGRVALRNISLSDRDTRRAEGVVRWQGAEHTFAVEAFAGGVSVIQSWGDASGFTPYPATEWTLAPFEMLITEAIHKERQDFLLEKWDKLLARDDVQRLLSRFTFDAHAEPGGARQRSWREKVDRVGFDIVAISEAQRLRDKLLPPDAAQSVSFRSKRTKPVHAETFVFRTSRIARAPSPTENSVS